jgi:pimeloyl-ACP methyl ester carboxylesterase
MFRRPDRPVRARPAGRAAPSRRVPTARLSTVALPDLDLTCPAWPARTVLVDGCGVRVRHTDGGPEPATYVHGLGGDSTNFTDLAALLRPWLSGDSVDLPGFGGSDPALGGDYSLTRQAGVLARLLQQQGRGPVHLFGNSMGGVVCLLVAAARPDLVRTLTLISPAMPALRPRPGALGRMQLLALPGTGLLAQRYLSRLTPEEQVRALVATCFGDPTRVPEHRAAEAADALARRATLPWATPALVRSIRGLAASYLAVGPRSLWNLARRVTAPTLVVWGDRDRLVDVALAPRTAAAIPDARLLVLPGVGHVAHIEDPVPVARAFLAMLEDTGPPEDQLTTHCERLSG